MSGILSFNFSCAFAASLNSWYMTRDGPSIRLTKPVCHMTTQTEDASSDSGTKVEDVATMETGDLDRFCDLHVL